MDPQPENPRPPNRRENQIQGPRPSPLRISKDSHKISKKPPIPPKPMTQQPLPATGNQPVIIYSVSPKPIFVDPSNFRSIVQHLTGNQSSSSESAGDLPVSPAARYASIERTSPSDRDRREKRGDEVYHMMMMNNEINTTNNNSNNNSNSNSSNDGMQGVSMGQNPGILSPSPANLPAISSAMFSPMAENQFGIGLGFGMNEIMMSPFMSNSSSNFITSPSSLFFSNAPIVSPSPSSLGDFFNIFDL